jgi:ubiquinone/menaquinone biosynthesis C-methylase UbiE
MNLNFIQRLIDPVNNEQLKLESPVFSSSDEVFEGYLVSSLNRYPIIGGVPRFVQSENYTSSFGYQWNKWSKVQFDSENVNGPMSGYTTKMWETIMGDLAHLGPNSLVLDIGCGPGRFIEVALAKGAKVIGLDYSNAVNAAYNNFKGNPNVCIVQADALQMPFALSTFDYIYTIGVLHHTPNAYKGVEEAYRVLKQSGIFGISVYGKSGYYDFPTVQLWRKFFNFLRPVFGNYPPLIYTYFVVNIFGPIRKYFPFLGRVIKLFFPFISIPDKRWSILDTFDSVTPSYQSAHESFEVFKWLESCGFSNIRPSNWGFTAYTGKK